MIVNVEYLFSLPEFRGKSESELNDTLKAVELMVRAYTKNNFQNKAIRFEAEAYSDKIFGKSPFLKAGDTIQISKSACIAHFITEGGDTGLTGIIKDR